MLPQRRIETLTFRDKIRDGATLARELMEHLDQAVIPKIQRIKEDIRSRSQLRDDDLPDVTVRNLVAVVLDGEEFTSTLCDRIEQYGRAIVSEADQILHPHGQDV
ncbi:hypothetical protein GC163_07970 [bacterium]|nr:hypothetical protein [bacterium]